MKVLTHISLFTGIGGIDLAAEWAGFRTILMVENNAYCQKVLNKHWPDVPIIGDIKDVKGTGYTATLITGGFPCQPVSQAGKRRGEEDDRWLWPEMLRVIKEVRPKWVVAENVAGLVGMGIDDCLSGLENSGYTTEAYLIPACAVNAPHRRGRVFLVGNSPGISGDVIQNDRIWGKCGSSQEWQPGRPNITALPRGGDWDVYQPRICGEYDGLPNRVDRLKALGNAVVPQQIYPILKAIAAIADIHW